MRLWVGNVPLLLVVEVNKNTKTIQKDACPNHTQMQLEAKITTNTVDSNSPESFYNCFLTPHVKKLTKTKRITLCLSRKLLSLLTVNRHLLHMLIYFFGAVWPIPVGLFHQSKIQIGEVYTWLITNSSDRGQLTLFSTQRHTLYQQCWFCHSSPAACQTVQCSVKCVTCLQWQSAGQYMPGKTDCLHTNKPTWATLARHNKQ